MEKVFIDIMCHFNKVDAVFKEVFCIKRLITAVILCIWTVCACAAVYAADPVDYADSLCSIGLFRGTENGYEIQKPLTRGEGAQPQRSPAVPVRSPMEAGRSRTLVMHISRGW